MKTQDQNVEAHFTGRRWFVLCLFLIAATGLAFKIIYLQLLEKDFLQSKGNSSYSKVVPVSANRGVIHDRNGEPLAISTPISAIIGNPKKLVLNKSRWAELAKILDVQQDYMEDMINKRAKREFVYLKRQATPQLAAKVMALKIPGVSQQKEYQRFYPAADVAAHVVGFTNIDDKGQEGIELAYNKLLKGDPGKKLVIKDLKGHTIENVESVKAAQPGKDLTLSIDKRIQYLAYRELTAAVLGHKAKSGSIVVLDANSGEILAMVNQPSYNPNNRYEMKGEHYRNRAVTDVFEPGSTIKPFTVATALELGTYKPDTMIDTRPGQYRVGRHMVRDIHNYEVIDVSTVIKKSSNVGVSKIALSMEAEVLWNTFDQIGLGTVSGVGFPGEASGRLRDYSSWRDIEQATMSFGYGMSVTTLQLAQAYMVLANKGVMTIPSLIKVEQPEEGDRVMSEKTARLVLEMMEGVVQTGTGKQARIPGYRVAGKTGTAHKSSSGGYAEDRYQSVFAGIVPVSNPRLVSVVMINEPSQGEYYGGQVAAPAFAKLMGETLRLMNVSPDDVSEAITGEHKLMAGRQP
ncbi:MAG: peptidoglycan D,D-transpeptidase FtsI family protein [Gammaproteobacteria bacterium]